MPNQFTVLIPRTKVSRFLYKSLTMVPVWPVAPAGRGRQRRRCAGAAPQPEVNLPNGINAPAARISYYKLFLKFMKYQGNDAYEYGRLFSE